MEVKELRIGNYVKDPYDKIIKLVNVDSDASMLRPIPLTEEWLLKFGLRLNTGWDDMLFYDCAKHLDFQVYVFDTYYEVEWSKIKHVHQLQNIYFALTGEELEIKEYGSKLG